MTLDLAAIKVACEAATPSPWRAESRFRDEYDTSEGEWGDIDGPNNRSLFTVDMGDFNALKIEDARFISLARQALPECVAEIERLRGLLAEACHLARSFDVHGSQPGEHDRLDALAQSARLRSGGQP